MEGTKLYQTLSAFDAYELNRLKKFVDSPYFNSNDKISHLFDFLYDHLKGNGDHKLDKSALYAQIMPNEDYDDRKFRKLNSDLLKLIENFLSIEEYEKHPLHKANYLFKAVQEHKLENLYNSTVKSTRRLANRQPYRDSEYFLNQYQIEKNYYELTDADLNRSERSNIDAIIKNLDYFYLAEKLKYYCTLLSRRKIQKHEYDILFIDEILDHISEHDYSAQPLIKIYYHVFKLYEDFKNHDNYFELKDLLVTHSEIFPIDELRGIYIYIINFCIENANKGEQNFINELFEIYKQALEDNVLYIDDELSPWSFFNIVLTGLRVDEFEWVEYFILNYSKYLNEKHRKNAISFNMARLHYYKKEFDKVIPLLNEVEFTDFSYNLGAKAMILASYYELGEIDSLFSFLESFRVYLNRHKQYFPENRRKNYLNLIQYVKKLVNIVPGDKVELKKLEKEVEENVKVKSDIRWLKEKIHELQGKVVQ